MALSKNRIKYIRSLELKKNRKAYKVPGRRPETGRRFAGALPLPLPDCNCRMAFRP